MGSFRTSLTFITVGIPNHPMDDPDPFQHPTTGTVVLSSWNITELNVSRSSRNSEFKSNEFHVFCIGTLVAITSSTWCHVVCHRRSKSGAIPLVYWCRENILWKWFSLKKLRKLMVCLGREKNETHIVFYFVQKLSQVLRLNPAWFSWFLILSSTFCSLIQSARGCQC